jgi:hypothetical protein
MDCGTRNTAVAKIADENLVAGLECKRAEHGVGSRGGVVHEHEVLASGAQERGDDGGCFAQPGDVAPLPPKRDSGELSEDEPARMALDVFEDGSPLGHHAEGRNAYRAVVQVRAARV